MSKNLTITVLLDFYGELLTDKQRFSLHSYYEEDCSLSEIAENMAISRQGARDFIKRGEGQLIEYEQKLGLLKRFEQISRCVEKLEEVLKKSEFYEEIKPLTETIKDNL